MDRLTLFLQKQQPQEILDVCTGAGQFIQLLSSLYTEYRSIVGIDTLDIAVSTARKNLQHDERIKIRKMDAHHTTFKDNRFDLVVLSNSFHHIEDKHGLLQEMYRLTKPGGYILLSEMISNNLSKAQMSHLQIHHFAAEVDRYVGEYHENTYSSDELLHLISSVSPSSISEHWLLSYEHNETTSDDDIAWLKDTLDRMISRIKSKQDQQQYIKKAQQIKKDIDQNGFDSATTMIVVIQK